MKYQFQNYLRNYKLILLNLWRLKVVNNNHLKISARCINIHAIAIILQLTNNKCN